MSQKNAVPRDKIGLEKYLASLSQEKADLEKRGEVLRSEYLRHIQEGNADAALEVKREVEGLPVRLEILKVRIQAGQSRLSVLLANEPKAQKIQEEISRSWQEVKACLDSIDSIGAKLKENFDGLKRLESLLAKLGGEYALLTGQDPTYTYPHIEFAERLPANLNPYSTPLPLSQYVVLTRWSPWTFRPRQPE